MNYNRPEFKRMIVAYSACILMGVSSPLFAVFLAEFIGVLEENPEDLFSYSLWITFKWIILGIVLFFLSLL